MAPSNPTNPPGHAEFALIALRAFAAIGEVNTESIQSSTRPASLLGGILESLFNYAQLLYPEHELISRATLSLELNIEDHEIQLDSAIFHEYYLTFPDFAPFEDPYNLEGVRSDLYWLLRNSAYLCVAQVISTAEDSSMESMDDLPTREEFYDLLDWLAQNGYEVSEALSMLIGSDVIFGVRKDGSSPFAEYAESLQQFVLMLEANLELDHVTESTSWLRQFVLHELKVANGIIFKAADVHLQLDSGEPLESHLSFLTLGIVGSQIPEARAIAAEYVSYIFNRQSKDAITPDLAENLHRAAVAASTMALIISGSCRHAKYIAQNLLDIAHQRGDDFVLQCAEAIWVNAYITPFHALLSQAPSTFIDLQWTSEVYATPSPIAFADIPAHSIDPMYIYEGAGAEVLQSAVASFSTDHLAAAVLLVQYFKDLPLSEELANPDVSLPLFDPHGRDQDMFPLRQRHPIAWSYYIANALFAEQSLGNFHAGLVGHRNIGWDLRHWIEGVVDVLNQHLDGRMIGSFNPGFPAFASELLTPAAEDMAARGSTTLAKEWFRVVQSWVVN